MFTLTKGKVLNLAHRGARAWAPENTLPAFEKALALGADGFELDVHLTLDGQVVVHHDDDLLRCTNILQAPLAGVDHFISSYSLKQIQKLDAGSWFVNEYQAGIGGNSREAYLNILTESERADCMNDNDLAFYASGQVFIPTLAQVLELVESSGCIVNIELKALPRMYEELTEKVIELVINKGLEQQVILSSFDHQQLLLAKQIDPDLYTAVLSADRLAKVNEYLELLGAQAYNPGCYAGVDSLGFNSVNGEIDDTAIGLCREHGFGINVWTCNDPAHMQELVGLGVTGLISDVPNRVSAVLADENL